MRIYVRTYIHTSICIYYIYTYIYIYIYIYIYYQFIFNHAHLNMKINMHVFELRSFFSYWNCENHVPDPYPGDLSGHLTPEARGHGFSPYENKYTCVWTLLYICAYLQNPSGDWPKPNFNMDFFYIFLLSNIIARAYNIINTNSITCKAPLRSLWSFLVSNVDHVRTSRPPAQHKIKI